MNPSTTIKKAVIFVSAGLGDALLLVPLVKTLRLQGYEITGLFTSSFHCNELFEKSGIFDRILVANGKAKLALLAITEYKYYQLAIVNYFASSRTHLLVAQKMATMVHTNRIPEKAGKKLVSGLVYFEPRKGIHDAEQNMLLAGKGPVKLTEDLIHLDYNGTLSLTLPETFIALQISTGSNLVGYKNWPISYWIDFLNKCAVQYPALRFVLLGDSGEKALAGELLRANAGNVYSLSGQTTVGQALGVIAQSKMFLGLDGGLMHAAAALGRPSFSLWGPSNPLLYGYQNMNPEKHRVLSLGLSCSPCSAWIGSNTSRFSKPEQCPDLKCLNDLIPACVFQEFSTFAKKHALV